MTEPTLAEAVDCMLEGTAATKPCKKALYRLEDGKAPVSWALDGKMKGAKYTCAEGALIYGALSRGYDKDRIDDLIILLTKTFEAKYGVSHPEVNDSSTDDDPRQEVIAMAKDLL